LLASQHGINASAGTINAVSGVGFALACMAILALGLRAGQRPRVAQLGFLIVASFLIINKVYSPQYVLWLLPLAAVARPRWRDLLIWQACELAYFGWLASSSGSDAPAYQVAIVIRVIGEIYLMAVVVRDVWQAPASADHDPFEAWEPQAASADPDAVEGGRGVPHDHLDGLADLGHRHP
jgi:hypothetical protein